MGRAHTGKVVFLTSAAIILYEITLSRVFSVLMWYHFVSFAVALALCGMAAGSLFSVRASRMNETESSSFVFRFLLLAVISLGVVYFLLFSLSRFPSFGYRVLSPLHQTYYEPFAPVSVGRGASFFMTVTCVILLLSLPFIGGGAVFAACFERGGNDFNTYFSAMSGSAAGVLLYLGALETGSGPFALLIASAFFLLPAFFLLHALSRKEVILLLVFSAALLVCMANDLVNRPADPRFVRGRFVPDLLWSRWDAVSRVAVYPISKDELLKGFGQGRQYDGKPPEGLGMVVDDTGYTAMFGKSDEDRFNEFFRYNIASLPYLLKREGKALVIGPGGGKDIYSARSSGMFTIDAVEVNNLVVRAVQDVFGEFSGRPYTEKGVTMHRKEGRAFIEGMRESYDVIQMTQVFGRVPPHAGAFTLTENHLYTVEAMGRMLDSLTEGGILSITRFAFEKTGPRLLRMLREAMILSGWESPEGAILIAGSKGIMNAMVVRGGAGGDMTDRFLEECQTRGFEVLYSPGNYREGVLSGIIGGKEVSLEAAFDLSPPTDDRPFFYYTILPEDFLGGKTSSGKTTEEKGAHLVRKFLLFSLFLSILFPLPAALFSGSGSMLGKLTLLYAFLLTGLGFIMVEITLIKKLILPLGFPVYSLSCILLAVFIFSGTGSAIFSVLQLSARQKVILSAVALASILLLYRFCLDPITDALMRLGSGAKFGFSFLLAGLTGFFMGVPFPSLLTVYNSKYRGSKSVPIAINGFASVTGSMLALSVSMNLGYGTVFLLTGGIYAVVAFFAILS